MSAVRGRTAASAGRKRVGRAPGSAASNSIKRIALDPGSAQREEFYDHLGRIEDIFSVSGVQAVSVNAYINSILSTGVQTTDALPVQGMLLTTVVDLIKNLVLYGFSCYRILAFPDKIRNTMVVQVPSGNEMPVRFSSKLLRWVPDYKTRRRGTAMDLFDTSNDDVDNSDDEDDDDPFRWKTIVWMPPTESRCTSFAAQAPVSDVYSQRAARHPRICVLTSALPPTRYHDSVRIEELYKVHCSVFGKLAV